MNVLRSVTVILAAATMAHAADLNLQLTSNGSPTVSVAPGIVVPYEIVGVLSSVEDNDGLALFAIDLEFSGGPLSQADTPVKAPISHFANDLGINNPAGFGGTEIDGRLVQIGGGQNTIKNTPQFAPYPVGDVITGVGHDSIVLARGELTAPIKTGEYQLVISHAVANVIKPGQDAKAEFWEVEAAGLGTVTNMAVTVVDVIQIVSSSPPDGAIDGRRPSEVDGSNPDGWDQLVLTFDDAGEVLVEDILVSVSSGKAPNVTDVIIDGANATVILDGPIPTGAWTTFDHDPSGSRVRLGFLPADVNGDKTSAPMDILALIDGLNGVKALDDWQSDINRSGVFEPSDILSVIDLLNGAGEYEVWNGRTLPN